MLSSTSSCDTTPRVYWIAGVAPTADAHRILFLGAGFDSDAELETYRAAAQTLAEGLRTSGTMPYASYHEFLSFYRIDVRSSAIDTSSCSSSMTPACGHVEVSAPPSTLASTPLDTLNPSGDAVIDEDMHVDLCYTESSSAGPCRLIWADSDGQKLAAELATYAPDIDVVVILANTQLWSGAAVQGALSGSQSLVVVGLPQDASGAAIGLNLIGHELAHTLGLADEYSDSSGVSATLPSSYQNVWQPADGCYEPVTLASPAPPSGDALLVPWKDKLDCAKGLTQAWDCDSNSDLTDYGCPRVWWPYHNLPPTCPSVYPGLQRACQDFTGLYEGAFYTMSGIYRPAYDCKMRTVSTDFCVVCKDLIDLFFTCNYVHPGTC